MYDGQGSSEPIKVIDKLHRSPVTIIKYNPIYETVLSVDSKGMIEYWTGPKSDYAFPKTVLFRSKLDTDLFEFVESSVTLLNLAISPNGLYFAGLTSDRRVKSLFPVQYQRLITDCV